jgi:hypothetical protein
LAGATSGPTADGGRIPSYAATRAMMDVYPADLRILGPQDSV